MQNRNKNVIWFFMYMCEKLKYKSGNIFIWTLVASQRQRVAAIEKKTRATIIVNSKEAWFKLVEGAMKKQPFKSLDMLENV